MQCKWLWMNASTKCMCVWVTDSGTHLFIVLGSEVQFLLFQLVHLPPELSCESESLSRLSLSVPSVSLQTIDHVPEPVHTPDEVIHVHLNMLETRNRVSEEPVDLLLWVLRRRRRGSRVRRPQGGYRVFTFGPVAMTRTNGGRFCGHEVNVTLRSWDLWNKSIITLWWWTNMTLQHKTSRKSPLFYTKLNK